MKLEYQKSYVWLVPAFALPFFGLFLALGYGFDHPEWSFLPLPAFGLFVIVSQLRSGVALDGFWRASHLKGTRDYRLWIAWSVFWATAISVVTVLAVARVELFGQN